MKRMAIGLALLLASCGGADPEPGSRERSGRPQTSAPVTARVVLSSRTVDAGGSLTGRVVVTNRTGEPLQGIGCGNIFQVALRSDEVKPEVAWPLCAETLTIPPGRSTYPVTAAATYLSCSTSPVADTARCRPGGGLPPLPPGDYDAVLFQNPELVPAPDPVKVRVTGAS